MTLAEAVEALARAMGWWREDLDNRRGEWSIEVNEEPELGGAYTIRRWELVSASARRSEKAWRVSPLEAMLVLRCALLGTTRARCPDCEGARVVYWDGEDAHPPGCIGCPACAGPDVDCPKCHGSPPVYGSGAARKRRCDRCDQRGTVPGKPTGHVDRSWAEVLLGATPRPCEASVSSRTSVAHAEERAAELAERLGWTDLTIGEGLFAGGEASVHVTYTEPGDPEARAKLTRLADELQLQALVAVNLDKPEQAPELGVWLALCLGQQPCDVCEGRRTSDRTFGIPCEPCAGSGLALGSHAGAMADAGHALAEELDRRPRAAVK